VNSVLGIKGGFSRANMIKGGLSFLAMVLAVRSEAFNAVKGMG
jgi:hypothetical protein